MFYYQFGDESTIISGSAGPIKHDLEHSNLFWNTCQLTIHVLYSSIQYNHDRANNKANVGLPQQVAPSKMSSCIQSDLTHHLDLEQT